MQVSETVRIVPVPEDEPMRPTQTNIYIVGQPGGQVLTIDSGEAIDKFWWMLRGYLAAIRPVGDRSGGDLASPFRSFGQPQERQ